MKKLLLAALLISAQAQASSYVMCHFNSFTAKHSPSPVNVTATHDVSITNTAGSDRSYHVEYRMFIEKKLIHINAYDVTIKAGGTFTENKLETSQQIFKNPMNLSSSCQTIITRDDKNDIRGGGNITIT